MSKKDYYEVLGVSRDATEKEIKSAYRKLAMQYHPDKLKDGTSDQKMQELNQAYEVLSDKEKRANYDQYGSEEGPQGFGGFGDFGSFGGFGDIFSSFFGGSSRQKTNTPMRGDDLMARVQISFEDSIKGVEFEKKLQKWEACDSCEGRGAEKSSDILTCSTCKGTGQQQIQQRTLFGMMSTAQICSNCHGNGEIIKNPCKTCKGNVYIKKDKKVKFRAPEGCQTGDKISLTGYGEKGLNGGPAGNLIIEFQVLPHKYFVREGLNLFLEFPVSFIDIVKENQVIVPTPYGNETIQLRRSHQNGKILVLNGKGIRRSGRSGDLKIQLKIIIPDLSKSEMNKLANQISEFQDNTNLDFIKLFK